jgi:flagellar basal-body rod protein FlgC
MYNVFDVSTSGLVAQRERLNVISSNLANISTTRNEAGQPVPYTPRFVVFQTDEDTTTTGGGQGVKVDRVEYSNVEPNMKYEPGHPDANADGYVAYPNINMTTEFVDALGATRAYEANVGVIEATKDMTNRTLQILA